MLMLLSNRSLQKRIVIWHKFLLTEDKEDDIIARLTWRYVFCSGVRKDAFFARECETIEN